MLFHFARSAAAPKPTEIRRKPLAPAECPALTSRHSSYPEPFKSRMGDREKRRLGDPFGLTQFGVNLVRLAPGAQSALRHWHTQEDEFVYVLEGRIALVTDAGEVEIAAGQCIGYPGGDKNAHHFVNRGGETAVYLEVGSRLAGDNAFYPDDDLMWVETETGTKPAHKDGRFYE